MRIRILGSAAGGGLPQWNCRCANCDAARRGSPHVRPRTQSSVAISADGRAWFLLNVSADVRAQLTALSDLWPPAGAARGTTIAGCVLTDAEIDHASGLLQLREGCRFGITCTATVRRWLHEYLPIGPILAPFADRTWTDLPLDTPHELRLPSGEASGLSIRAFELSRETPRYVNEDPAIADGACIGLRVEDAATDAALVYAPGIEKITNTLEQSAAHAQCVLVDGTFWSDDEPQRMGIASITAVDMGHLPISGREGTLEWLGGLNAQHRVYVHMNNTNPVLYESSPEHAQVRERGVRVGMDGDLFEI